MQIKKLFIDNYLCLYNFNIRFNTVNGGSSTILIGENGSGKSTFIRALINIMMSFDSASIAENIEYDYKVEYEYAQKNIRIEKEGRLHNVDVDDQLFSGSIRTIKQKLVENNIRLFPQRIISFYSGSNKTFYEEIKKNDIQYVKKCRQIIIDYFQKGRKGKEILKDNLPKRKYIYCDESFVPIYLCAILAGPDSYEKQRLREQCKLSKIDRIVASLNVEFFDSIVGELRDYELDRIEQEWKNREQEWHRDEYEMVHHGYDRNPNELEWGRKAYKREFREYKKRRIEYQMRYFKDVLISFIEYLENKLVPAFENCVITPKNSKEVFVEIYNIEGSGIESNLLLDVFEKIKILYRAEYRVYVCAENKDKPIEVSTLSEGQRQLIKILGMLSVCKKEDCLVLMDEPDAFMNPRWGYNIKEKIDKILKTSINTQAIITTQNPLLINGVSKDYIRIFEIDKESGSTEVIEPNANTEGMGIDGLLQSEYYGMRTSYDKDTTEKFERRQELYGKLIHKEISNEEKEELRKLTKEISSMPISSNTIDFIYDDFIREFRKTDFYTKEYLTSKELRERSEKIKEIIQSLYEKKKK
jgi:ABC-type multidrug transport system ATPase subunit